MMEELRKIGEDLHSKGSVGQTYIDISNCSRVLVSCREQKWGLSDGGTNSLTHLPSTAQSAIWENSLLQVQNTEYIGSL